MFKVGLAQIEVCLGQVYQNAQNILEYIQTYKNEVDLFVFPELCLTGYLLGDLWEFKDFLNEAEYWNQKIIEASVGTSVIFGNVQVDWKKKGEDGRPRKYNAAILAQNGKALRHPRTGLNYQIKTLQPNYREFDDERHFYSLQKWCQESSFQLEEALSPFQVLLNGQKISLALTLCEDGWDDYYSNKPFSMLKKKSAQIIVNLSCSPFTINKSQKRDEVFGQQVAELNTTIIYSNCVGIQNNGKNIFTFEGGSGIYFSNGTKYNALEHYQEGFSVVDCDSNSKKNVALKTLKSISKIQQIVQALSYGSTCFLKQLKLDKVVIGVSGGIDSAVCAALYRQILPPENILLVSMPGPYTSHLTRSLAKKLADNLQCYFTEITIDECFSLTQKQLQNLKISSVNGMLEKELNLSSFHLENVQARDRSSRILSALSSSFGGVFTCNSNKVEMTVGYSTLYGDLGGFLALIGDLWKGEIYAVAQYLNKEVYHSEVIPDGTLTIVPSAELNAQQDVEKGQGDPLIYEYHDALFKSWVQGRDRLTPTDILLCYKKNVLQERLKCSKDPMIIFSSPLEFIQDLEKWWNQYQGMGVAKRIQSPPLLSLSSRSFGYDHRESIIKSFYSTQYQNIKKELLG